MDWKEALLKVPTNWTNWVIQMILAAVLVAGYVLFFRPDMQNIGIAVWSIAAVLSAGWVVYAKRRT